MNAKEPKKRTVITYMGKNAYPEVANGRIAQGQIGSDLIVESILAWEICEQSKKTKKPRRRK